MAGNGFLPDKDAALLAWSLNFSTLITATPTAYGLTAPQATAYTALHTAYATALGTCEPGVRNKTNVLAKNDARTHLKISARLLAKIVEGTATVTNPQKATLGLTVRAIPTPIPPPAFPPALDVVTVVGRTVRVRLHEAGSTRRGKPAGVDGAAVMSYVGATPPADVGDWKLEGLTSKTVFDVAFAATLAPGATVWLSAYWFNERKQSGPACTPISVTFGSASGAMAA